MDVEVRGNRSHRLDISLWRGPWACRSGPRDDDDDDDDDDEGEKDDDEEEEEKDDDDDEEAF